MNTYRILLAIRGVQKVDTIGQARGPVRLFFLALLKLPLRGKRLQLVEEIKENATGKLKTIPSSSYQGSTKEWAKPWHMCVSSDESYFEVDKMNSLEIEVYFVLFKDSRNVLIMLVVKNS